MLRARFFVDRRDVMRLFSLVWPDLSAACSIPTLRWMTVNLPVRSTDTRFRLGIDLGGTKTEILALDPNGVESFRRRLPTPQGDYAAMLRTIATLVDAAEQTLGASGSVGIGTPGSISRATGLLRGSNSVCMNGKPIKRDLEELLGREVRITNDANCFALSEASDGAGRGFG